MSEEHTPGPWTAYEFGADWWVANATDDSGPMLRVGSWHADREANAHLIAAAPDLLEALRPFAACCEGIADSEDDEEWAKFRLLVKNYRAAAAAVAKALGHD